jgi:hypothetical protein
VVAVGTDNWSILRNFAKWFPPAAQTYADDQFTSLMKQHPMPFRSYDPSGDRYGQVGTYQASALMAQDVPTLFGYQGMESKFFDELFGTKNDWTHQFNASLWDLYAIDFITTPIPIDTIAGLIGLPPAIPAGFHKVMGPTAFPQLRLKKSAEGYLYQRDSAAQWVRVIPAAVKAPDSLIVPTVTDPRFPLHSVVLYPDTVNVPAVAPGGAAPAPATVKATLAKWQPGAMTVKLDGSDTRTTYLMVAENWYPDWHATIDGKAAPTLRADGALLSVALPPGAREVELVFDVKEYHTGRLLTIISLLISAGLIGAGMLSRKRAHG